MKRAVEYSKLFLVALACTALPVHACMNDRDSDSLAEEGRDLPDVVRVVTGRFERNPPLFYQMRIARVQQELQSQPRAFNLYDDISVAFDRLGKSDEAIRWIEKKRSLLPPFNAKDQVLKEHWYRYHANIGTFQAHRWLRAGANRKKINEMVRARDHIRRAIKIKPDAHFGREKYQLAAMEWIIKPSDDKESRSLPSFIDKIEDEAQIKEAVEGLSGLVVLGNAWESVDVFNALKVSLKKDGHVPLAYLAQLRSQELVDEGRKSLLPSVIKMGKEALKVKLAKGDYDYTPIALKDEKEIDAAYKVLRTEAETWQTARTKYMLARLRQGNHPDVDKTFWNEYSNTEPPSLAQLTPRGRPRWWRAYFSDPTRITFHLFLFVISLPLFFILGSQWKKYRRNSFGSH